MDPSDEICGALLQPFDVIPKRAKELVPLIGTPLLRKLPVLDDVFDQIARDVCWFPALSVSFSPPIVRARQHPTSLQLVECVGGDLANVLTTALHDSTGRDAATAAAGSEDMMHSPVDALLRRPLTTLSHHVEGKLPITIDRNRTDESVLISSDRDKCLMYVSCRQGEHLPNIFAAQTSFCG